MEKIINEIGENIEKAKKLLEERESAIKENSSFHERIIKKSEELYDTRLEQRAYDRGLVAGYDLAKKERNK